MTDTKAVRALADKRANPWTPVGWEANADVMLRQCADELDRQVEIINGLSMVIDQNLLDLEVKDKKIERLKAQEPVVLTDAEMRTGIALQLKEIERLLSDNAAQSSIIDQLEDRLGMINDGGDTLSRLENERDTLRELVRSQDDILGAHEAGEKIAELRSENESATTYLRTISEELVIAGYAGGDRDVTLANLRAVIRDRDTLRELVREAMHAYMHGNGAEWYERAEKALKNADLSR